MRKRLLRLSLENGFCNSAIVSSMSMIVGTLALLMLTLALFVPAFAALTRRSWAWLAIPLYGLLIGGMFAYHVGFGADEAASSAVERSRSPQAMCEQAVNQFDQAGLIIDRTQPGRVIVNSQLWARVPSEAKDALIDCLERVRRADTGAAPLQVIER